MPTALHTAMIADQRATRGSMARNQTATQTKKRLRRLVQREPLDVT